MEEKPDSILPTLGGQNALNIAMALADEGFLEEHNVRIIGTNTDTIKLAEDRLEFKNLMERINEPCAASIVVNHVNDALEFARKNWLSSCCKTCLYIRWYWWRYRK